MPKKTFKPGDIVEYKGEAWCVGYLFEDGTYRVQKGPEMYHDFVIRVSKESLKPVSRNRLLELSKKGDKVATGILKESGICDEPLTDEERHIIQQAKHERELKARPKEEEDWDI